MADLSPQVGVAEVGVALLVLKEAFTFVHGMVRGTNGHAKVRSEDAPEFFVLQKEILHEVKESRRRIDAIEARIERRGG